MTRQALWRRVSLSAQVCLNSTAHLDGNSTDTGGVPYDFVAWAKRLLNETADKIGDHGWLTQELARYIKLEHPTPLVRPPSLRRNVSDEACRRSGAFRGLRASPAFIVDVVIFGYDLDVLELRLHELDDVVDLWFVVEMPWNHRGARKPLLWKEAAHTERFKEFRDRVVSVVVDRLPPGMKQNHGPVAIGSFDYEVLQMIHGVAKVSCILEDLRKQGVLEAGNVMMCYGDADEIPHPENVHLLRHCVPKKLPINNAIWMPMGLMMRACATDFPVIGLPYSLAFPVFHDAFRLKEIQRRNLGAAHDPSRLHLLGGWHLTNYIYPPYYLLKAIGCAECSGALNRGAVKRLAYKIDEWVKRALYPPWWNRTRFASLERLREVEPYKSHPHVLDPPRLMQYNRERYEVWYGKIDKRVHVPV